MRVPRHRGPESFERMPAKVTTKEELADVFREILQEFQRDFPGGLAPQQPLDRREKLNRREALLLGKEYPCQDPGAKVPPGATSGPSGG